jgi:hypothetical protein
MLCRVTVSSFSTPSTMITTVARSRMAVQILAMPRATGLPDDATRAIASTEPVSVAHRAALRWGKSVFRSPISATATTRTSCASWLGRPLASADNR